jgi:hypothetical protein
MSARRTLLDLLELGERDLPSAVGLQPIVEHGGMVAAAVVTHPLRGTGTGTYHGPQVTIDAGASFNVSGTAHLAGLGTFRMTGSVEGVGMVEFGRASGELVLSNAHGTITIELHGAVQPAFSQVPSVLVYSVTKGTGDFRHLTGYGSVAIHRTPAPVAFGQPPVGRIALAFSWRSGRRLPS